MSEVNKKIISLEVRGEYILGSGVAIGAEGSFDSVYLRIKFDEHWLGLNIYATWQDALGNIADQQIFVTALDLVDGEPNTYDIPVTQFVTNYPGTVRLALSGYAIGGEAGNEIESLTNTVSGAFRVLKSGASRLDSGKIPATLEEQVVAKLNETTKLLKDAEDDLAEFEAAEGAREEAEAERVKAENSRKEAENAREEAEAKRKSGYAKIESLVGNIDEALDAIIDIQNSLIGGDE